MRVCLLVPVGFCSFAGEAKLIARPLLKTASQKKINKRRVEYRESRKKIEVNRKKGTEKVELGKEKN